MRDRVRKRRKTKVSEGKIYTWLLIEENLTCGENRRNVTSLSYVSSILQKNLIARRDSSLNSNIAFGRWYKWFWYHDILSSISIKREGKNTCILGIRNFTKYYFFSFSIDFSNQSNGRMYFFIYSIQMMHRNAHKTFQIYSINLYNNIFVF